MKYHFASDNTAGVCPEAWEAMQQANDVDYLPSYGNDRFTEEASNLFRDLFETDCDVYFVFNGTAANSVALASICQSYHSIIAHEKAHIEVDECGAPQFFSNGTKLLLSRGEHGKMKPKEVEKIITYRDDIHYPKPKVVSLTQSTEVGTIYQPSEVQALCELANEHNMNVHMDGARFANVVAALKVAPKELTWKTGVDVLCFGGTKQGMAMTEAVIFFNHELSKEFGHRCKQAGQLASKMRFLAASWIPMLKNGTWLKHAAHSNACAQRLAKELEAIPGMKILHPVETNGVFVSMPEHIHEGLTKVGWRYYTFIGGGARLMCSWRTTDAEIDALLNDIRSLLK